MTTGVRFLFRWPEAGFVVFALFVATALSFVRCGSTSVLLSVRATAVEFRLERTHEIPEVAMAPEVTAVRFRSGRIGFGADPAGERAVLASALGRWLTGQAPLARLWIAAAHRPVDGSSGQVGPMGWAVDAINPQLEWVAGTRVRIDRTPRRAASLTIEGHRDRSDGTGVDPPAPSGVEVYFKGGLLVHGDATAPHALELPRTEVIEVRPEPKTGDRDVMGLELTADVSSGWVIAEHLPVSAISFSRERTISSGRRNRGFLKKESTSSILGGRVILHDAGDQRIDLEGGQGVRIQFDSATVLGVRIEPNQPGVSVRLRVDATCLETSDGGDEAGGGAGRSDGSAGCGEGRDLRPSALDRLRHWDAIAHGWPFLTALLGVLLGVLARYRAFKGEGG